MLQVTQAINFTNNYTRQFGVEIIPVVDWPEADPENREFLTIATEIGYVLKLAFGFSTQSDPVQLKPNDNFTQLAKGENVSGVTYSALVFGKDKITIS